MTFEKSDRNLKEFSFGPDQDALAELVLKGEKTAASSLFSAYVFDLESVPKTGDHCRVLISGRRTLCEIEILDVRILPFAEVTEEMAHLEGEEDKTLTSWKKSHISFFKGESLRVGQEFNEKSLIVFEKFKVLSRY